MTEGGVVPFTGTSRRWTGASGPMWFCWRCAEHNGWQTTVTRRVAECEVCGQRDDCSIAARTLEWAPVGGDTEALVDVPHIPTPRELSPWEQAQQDTQAVAAMIAVAIAIIVVCVPVLIVMANSSPAAP